MTNPRFEVISIDENGKERIEETVQTEWEAVKYINRLANLYGPSKDQLAIGPKILKLTFRQVWVLDN